MLGYFFVQKVDKIIISIVKFCVLIYFISITDVILLDLNLLFLFFTVVLDERLVFGVEDGQLDDRLA